MALRTACASNVDNEVRQHKGCKHRCPWLTVFRRE